MRARLCLAVTLGCTLLLCAALGAYIALVCFHDLPVRADLQVCALCLIAWGLSLSWRWVNVLIAHAVQREQQAEAAWHAKAKRNLIGDAR